MTARDTRERKSAGSVEQLCVALVAGMTVEQAAASAGMSEATARRRLRDPDVRTKLDDLRTSTLTTAADRLASLSLGAVVTLGQVFADRDMPAAVRVRAATAVLAHAVPIRDAALVEQRLAQVEAALAARERWAS